MLENLHGVELEGIVENGVEDEDAPGLHVGDGLEGIDGETTGHAADELVARDGPDRIARGVGLLNGQRKLEAPFEHHLENDIKFSAVRFNHIKHKLTRLRSFNTRIVKLEHTEANVGKPLGFLTKLDLTVGFLEFGFDFVACAADAFFADVAESCVAIFEGFTALFELLRELNKNPLTTNAIFNMATESRFGSRAGPGKEVHYHITWLNAGLNQNSNQFDWFCVIKIRNAIK